MGLKSWEILMKQWICKTKLILIMGLLIPTFVCAATQIGFVNVSQVFNHSSFVNDANKQLQADISQMNTQLEQQRNKLRQLIEQYHAAKSKDAKKNLESPLKTEEMVLKNLTSSFQKKVQQDEVSGKQHFDALLRKATERVAKTKHINAIITEQSVLYSDNSWLNLTTDVERVLQQITEEDVPR